MIEVIPLNDGITDDDIIDSIEELVPEIVEETLDDQLKYIRQHCQMLERQLDVVGNVLLQQVHALQLLQEEE